MKSASASNPRSYVGGIYVAAQGSGGGLYRFADEDGSWAGVVLDPVDELSALARHPLLDVLYGVSGGTSGGRLHVWAVKPDACTLLSEVSSGGGEPCHLAVDSSGRMLVVTNYSSSSLSIWALSESGELVGTPEIIELVGGGSDPDRQEAAHPHQVVFSGDTAYVVDLGADAVRCFRVGDSSLRPRLEPQSVMPVPAGTGPRHLALLPGGGLALTGELASTVLSADSRVAAAWRESPSSTTRNDGKPWPVRNFPGDIQRSPDGKLVYVANRGYDTIAAFEVGNHPPRLVAEVDAGVRWPQHLLVAGDRLLVAGRDSSAVAVVELLAGVPKTSRVLFECPEPTWLQAW